MHTGNSLGQGICYNVCVTADGPFSLLTIINHHDYVTRIAA